MLLSVRRHDPLEDSVCACAYLPSRSDTADSSDNVSGATAIAKGLAAGHSAAKPGYWIHLSGTSILTWYDSQNGRHGEAPIPEQKYADIDDIQRLVTLPDEAHHRNVDKIVQEAISDSVRVAIVCPPTIYGTGSGAVSTRSVQVPDLVVATLDLGYAPIVGAGLTEWDHIHIDDLTDLFVRFVEATQDPSLNSNPEVFGLNGYFFAEHGSHKWADVAHWIADEAAKQGFLAKPETKSVSMAEALKLEGPTTASWGRNSKSVAQRANKYLGWKATGKWSLRDEIAPLVASEAKARGVSKVA